MKLNEEYNSLKGVFIGRVSWSEMAMQTKLSWTFCSRELRIFGGSFL